MSLLTDIEVHLVNDDTGRGILAIANVTVAGAIRLTGIRVSRKVGEAFKVLYPSRDTGRAIADFFYPVGAHKDTFDTTILNAYHKTAGHGG